MHAQGLFPRGLVAVLAPALMAALALAGCPRQVGSSRPSAAQWQRAAQDLLVASADVQELVRLQFADGLQAAPEPSGASLACTVSDDYGRFVLLSSAPRVRFGTAGGSPVRHAETPVIPVEVYRWIFRT